MARRSPTKRFMPSSIGPRPPRDHSYFWVIGSCFWRLVAGAKLDVTRRGRAARHLRNGRCAAGRGPSLRGDRLVLLNNKAEPLVPGFLLLRAVDHVEEEAERGGAVGDDEQLWDLRRLAALVDRGLVLQGAQARQD